MKKVMALCIAITLFISLAVPGFAAASPTAQPEDTLPEIQHTTDKNMVITPVANVDTLSEQTQQEIQEAVDTLPEQVQGNQVVQDVFHVQLSENKNQANVTIKSKNLYEPTILQNVDGEWVEKETQIKNDGSVMIKDVENGTVAVIIELVPSVVHEECQAIAEEEVPLEVKAEVTKARNSLENTVPNGMLIRNFFYAETMNGDAADNENDSQDATFVFQTKAFNKLVIKQFINGKWIELKFTVTEDGMVTVFGAVDGPMAVFVG